VAAEVPPPLDSHETCSSEMTHIRAKPTAPAATRTPAACTASPEGAAALLVVVDGVPESVEAIERFAAEVKVATVEAVPTAPTAAVEVTIVEGMVETSIVEAPVASVDAPASPMDAPAAPVDASAAPKALVTIDISAIPTELR